VEALVDVFVELGGEQRVECLRKVITVVRGTIRVWEGSAKLLFDELRLVRKRALKCRGLYTKKFGNDAKNIYVANNSSIDCGRW